MTQQFEIEINGEKFTLQIGRDGLEFFNQFGELKLSRYEFGFGLSLESFEVYFGEVVRVLDDNPPPLLINSRGGEFGNFLVWTREHGRVWHPWHRIPKGVKRAYIRKGWVSELYSGAGR